MAASGLTSAGVVSTLREKSVAHYKDMLVGFGTKSAIVEKMVAGFTDGFNTAVGHLEKMEVISIAQGGASADAKAP